MATIYDEVTPRFLSTKWEEKVQEQKPYLGEAFFPERKQLGIALDYLQGSKPVIRPLDLSSFDAKAIPLSREAFKVISTEMPFFKNFLSINEKQRQQLNLVLASGNRAMIDAILGEIFNDEKRLLDNASITREMLRMQLLTSGAIAFASNGQAISYDFGVPEGNKVSSDWHDADADPIADLNEWADKIQTETGDRPTAVLMNSNTMRLISKLASVKNAIYVFANGTVTPNVNTARRYIQTETALNIYLYDKGYTDETNGNFVKFVADDVVCLFNPANLGEGVFGTTPEESDLMSGATSAVVEIVDGGVAITAEKLTDPVNVKTKVSMIYLPILTNANGLVIADVSAQ